ncbi:hypothetical protein L2E82_33149 [Cichorium intybus]|uniref:Uncharacterized protein n=1 Tax=Cichorium intybus TaxID=13427 RepID=A0ACB9BJD5_CICIN|nr:hypothetical protein L2E82_33149 [Cichorium intybus]
MRKQVSLPYAQLRLLQLRCHTIYEVFTITDKIEHLKSEGDWSLRAEEIPEVEKNMGPGDRRIHVYHYTIHTIRDERCKVENFGEPFLLVVGENESLASVKVRIQRKLEVPHEEFPKEERKRLWDNRYLELEHTKSNNLTA